MISFLNDESGAVTVDWVVLTGAVVGLGLATTAVVSAGVENMSGDVAGELASVSLRDRFVSFTQSMGFDNGPGGWLNGSTSYDEAYGNVLRGGGSSGQATQNTFALDGDSAFAVVSFDMHAIDSWDGESFDIYIDNALVASASFSQHSDSATGTWVTDNPDISFAVEASSGRGHAGYSSEWSDQSFRMQVTVANPGNDVTVGFGSSLDQEIHDESWAVDNISVVETNDVS